jgi:F0F1-type ATP synthase alpha subunit
MAHLWLNISYKGKATLIIYDDLNKRWHIVKCHYYYVVLQDVRLTLVMYSTYIPFTERAASDALGGGSMTALQLLKHKQVMFQHIPTNVISITDGQIFPIKRFIQRWYSSGY